MSYEKKLLAMKSLVKKAVPVEKQPEQTFQKPPAPAYEKRWLTTELTKTENDFGIVYERTVRYPLSHMHGSICLGDVRGKLEHWDETEYAHPLSPDGRLLFFDTETTGLKGAGVVIFLIGLLEMTETEFVMTQYVLPNPDHEAAFLYASKLWERDLTLVTYNGKSFDFPQLETRWAMHRGMLPPLPKAHQIDLLHGSRRIWKGEMTSFKLAEVEKQQLGFSRKDDVPGHMAPIIYQDAVKNGRAELLMKVLRHNEWDILSLVTLFSLSTDLVLQQGGERSAAIDTNIAKWFKDLGLTEQSYEEFQRIADTYGDSYPLTHYHFGFLLKQRKLHEQAMESFSIVINSGSGREQIIACEELAKLLEHQQKDFDKAAETVQTGKRLLASPDLSARFIQRMEKAFAKRQFRLDCKKSRTT